MKEKNSVPAFRFIYKLVECDNSTFDGMSVDLRANSREEGDIIAAEKATLFGIYTKAKFIKEI